MLRSLKLRNFQIHRSITFEFDQITTLVGSNGVGKSTALRGLRWILLNRGPKKVHSWGTDDTRAIAVFGDHKVVRGKGKGKGNYYEIDGKGKNKAIGTEVPGSVRDAINLGEENFQRQFDSHFWFALTPGQVSKELNKIVNLEMIDNSLANLAKETREAKAEVRVSKERLSQAQKNKRELAWVLEVDLDLQKVEALDAQVREKDADIQTLGDLLEKAAQHKAAAQTASKLGSYATEAVILEAQYASKAQQVKQLESLLESLESKRELICRLTESLGKTETILKKMMESNCPLCGHPMS